MKKVIFITILLASTICYGQTPTTLLIEDYVMGNVGQFTANALVIQTPCMGLTDTVFSVECYLIYVSETGSVAFPPEAAHFTVTGLIRSLYLTPIAQLVGWKTAILNTPNPHLVLR